MPLETPIYSWTYVVQAKTTTYSHSIANLSCTLSSNDVRINTPEVWGVTQAEKLINVKTLDNDLLVMGSSPWNDPGVSIYIENINCQNEGGVGFASSNFKIMNEGFDNLKLYGVLINRNGNASGFIEDLSLTYSNETIDYSQFMASGGNAYFTLGEGDTVLGSFTIRTFDDDENSSPDGVPPFPTLEIFSDDIKEKPQTVVGDFDIGDESLQSRWDVSVSWTVKPFITE